jgi:hypothetical protein
MLPFKPDAFDADCDGGEDLRHRGAAQGFSAKDLKEFIAYAKSNPGKINLGHAGVGSSNFLICKSFIQAQGSR